MHGLYEWFCYDPGLDRLIAPLIFSFAGDGQRNTLLDVGVGPEDVYPDESVYLRLAAAGVASHVAHPAPIADTPPSRRLLRGSTVHPFESADDGFAALGAALAAEERGYGLVYLPEVDALMHLAGPDDPAAAELFDESLSAIERAARGGVFPADTLVLLTADHGMAAITPERTTFVNVVWPEIVEQLAHGADGRPLAPAGSCRDLFLHVRPDTWTRWSTGCAGCSPRWRRSIPSRSSSRRASSARRSRTRCAAGSPTSSVFRSRARRSTGSRRDGSSSTSAASTAASPRTSWTSRSSRS